MLWTDQIPATGLSWRYVWGEVLELIEEIKLRDVDGVISETCDVYTCVMCAIETSTGVPMPLLWRRSANKFISRGKWFSWYLNQVGLEYKEEYLVHGGNYKKAWKRRAVVDLAIKDQLQ